MRTLGIELAVAGAHRAVAADDRGEPVTPLLVVHPDAGSLDAMLQRARDGASTPDLQAVMEPTGMVWFPIAAYLSRHGVPVYLVSGQHVADLRRFYKRHAKSDRIDARILARLPLVNPEGLHALSLPTATGLAAQRACREANRLTNEITAMNNRLRDLDRWTWPGLEGVVFSQHLSSAARWFRSHWYDPHRIVAAGADAVRTDWRASGVDADDPGDWVERLVVVAQHVLCLYGDADCAIDYASIAAEAQRLQQDLELLEVLLRTVQGEVMRPLYVEMHPSRHLETIKGVGVDSAAVYVSLIGNVSRFGSTAEFRGWSGMIPGSKQSGDSEAKGLRITKTGPNLIKKYAYLNAEVARQWDPQIAAIYYDQMVHKGKHHRQAVCACATHLLDRVYRVLTDDRAYELRDVDGNLVTGEEARRIIAAQYTVPAEVRRQRTKTARRARRDRQAEKTRLRESAP